MSKIHSVSLIPYHNKKFLICEEYRTRYKYDKKQELKKHLIGGKINKNECTLMAACREFCEEIPLLYDYKQMYEILNKQILYYIDVLVNSKKQIFHRFYMFHVISIEHGKLKYLLNNIMKIFKRKKSSLHNLIYWDSENDVLTNTSTLLDMFIESSLETPYIKIPNISK